VLEQQPGRIDDGEGAAVPVGIAVQPIARGSGDVLDDRFAFADQAVEKGRFPDVRPADDRDDRLHEALASGTTTLRLASARQNASTQTGSSSCSSAPRCRIASAESTGIPER